MATDQRQLIRDAVAVMTAWAAEQKNTGFAVETELRIADERYPDDPDTGTLYVLGGLGTLCGLLLALLENETGVSKLATLQAIGRQYAG